MAKGDDIQERLIDFSVKVIGLCGSLPELHETNVWLEIGKRARLLPLEKVQPAIRECTQLARIIGASRVTARTRSR